MSRVLAFGRMAVLCGALLFYFSTTAKAKEVPCNEQDEFYCAGALATAFAICGGSQNVANFECDPFNPDGCSASWTCIF